MAPTTAKSLPPPPPPRPVVKALLAAGADANVADDESATPLQVAAEMDDIYTVSALLRANANVHESNCKAMAIACKWGHTAIAKALLEVGAEKDMTVSNGWTPLLLAADAGHLPVVKMLLDASNRGRDHRALLVTLGLGPDRVCIGAKRTALDVHSWSHTTNRSDRTRAHLWGLTGAPSCPFWISWS